MATTYFGNNVADNSNQVESAGYYIWNLNQSLTCPGSGTQNIVEMSLMAYTSSTGNFRIALYTTGGSYIGQTGEIAVSGGSPATWQVVTTGFQGTTTLTGGTRYIVFVAWTGPSIAVGGTTSGAGAGDWYYHSDSSTTYCASGFPATITVSSSGGSSIGTWDCCVRIGVTPAGNTYAVSASLGGTAAFVDDPPDNAMPVSISNGGAATIPPTQYMVFNATDVAMGGSGTLSETGLFDSVNMDADLGGIATNTDTGLLNLLTSIINGGTVTTTISAENLVALDSESLGGTATVSTTNGEVISGNAAGDGTASLALALYSIISLSLELDASGTMTEAEISGGSGIYSEEVDLYGNAICAFTRGQLFEIGLGLWIDIF